MQLQKQNNLDLSIIDNLDISDLRKKDLKIIGNVLKGFLTENNRNLDFDSLQDFKAFLIKAGKKESTINKYMYAVKTIIKRHPAYKDTLGQYAIDNGFKKIHKRYKEDRAVRDGDYLTREQIDELISAAPERVKLFIEFLFVTGCRVSEMINVKLKDLNSNGNIKIDIIGKGRKQRKVYIKPELYNRILDEIKPKEYLFENEHNRPFTRQLMFRFFNRLDIHPHLLRHSCAMYLKEKGASIKYISEYLGHSSIAITAEYYFHDKPGPDVVNYFD